jgi:hypothetical protein
METCAETNCDKPVDFFDDSNKGLCFIHFFTEDRMKLQLERCKGNNEEQKPIEKKPRKQNKLI